MSAPLVVALFDRAFRHASWREAFRQRWPFYAGLASTWVLLGLLVAGLWAWSGRREALELPGTLHARPLATEAGIQAYPAFSPDGRSVAYSGEIDDVLQSNAEDFVKSYVQKGGQ